MQSDEEEEYQEILLKGRAPMQAIDPRVDAVRRDLADVRLAERVFAPHYAAPLPRTLGREQDQIEPVRNLVYAIFNRNARHQSLRKAIPKPEYRISGRRRQ